MNQLRQNFPDKQTQNTTASIIIDDDELVELFTPLPLPNTSNDTHATEASLIRATVAATPNQDAVAYKKAYFKKKRSATVSAINSGKNLEVLKNVAQNDAAAAEEVMIVEGKKEFKEQIFLASIRATRTAMRLQMKDIVTAFRGYSQQEVSTPQYGNELALFWNALEIKMMHAMQAEVKKKNVTVSIGHLRPQAMRLLEFDGPTPAACKYQTLSTKLNGSEFKYQQYKLVYKFQEWASDVEHNAYGIPSDASKLYKWFLIKYQAENSRWYFVQAKEVRFLYNFLLQEVKVCISFDTWLFMPAGLVRGIDQGHWICS